MVLAQFKNHFVKVVLEIKVVAKAKYNIYLFNVHLFNLNLISI